MRTGKQMSLSISSDQGLALSSFMACVYSVGEIQHRKKIIVEKGGWRTCESYGKDGTITLGPVSEKGLACPIQQFTEGLGMGWASKCLSRF